MCARLWMAQSHRARGQTLSLHSYRLQQVWPRCLKVRSHPVHSRLRETDLPWESELFDRSGLRHIGFTSLFLQGLSVLRFVRQTVQSHCTTAITLYNAWQGTSKLWVLVETTSCSPQSLLSLVPGGKPQQNLTGGLMSGCVVPAIHPLYSTSPSLTPTFICHRLWAI